MVPAIDVVASSCLVRQRTPSCDGRCGAGSLRAIVPATDRTHRLQASGCHPLRPRVTLSGDACISSQRPRSLDWRYDDHPSPEASALQALAVEFDRRLYDVACGPALSRSCLDDDLRRRESASELSSTDRGGSAASIRRFEIAGDRSGMIDRWRRTHTLAAGSAGRWTSGLARAHATCSSSVPTSEQHASAERLGLLVGIGPFEAEALPPCSADRTLTVSKGDRSERAIRALLPHRSACPFPALSTLVSSHTLPCRMAL